MGSFCLIAIILSPFMLATFRNRWVQELDSEVLLLRMQNRIMPRAKVVALIAFGGYVLWNLLWLSRGYIPPSFFSYCTGLPCPTTGMTRSLLALGKGDLKNFFLYNPFTFIYLALMGTSLVILARQATARETLVLPSPMARSWALALSIGWLLKFAIGNEYW